MAHSFSGLNSRVKGAYGEAVTYTPTAGAPVAMTAIPVEPSEFEATQPGNVTGFWFIASDFATAPVRGETITFGGGVYEIERIDRDLADGLNVFTRKQ